MSDKAKNLGETCAYPTGHFGDPGMTLRQHLAGLAMQGITAHPEFGSGTFTGIAETAVKQADALIAELAKET